MDPRAHRVGNAQGSGGAVHLNVHVYALVLNGVFARTGGDRGGGGAADKKSVSGMTFRGGVPARESLLIYFSAVTIVAPYEVLVLEVGMLTRVGRLFILSAAILLIAGIGEALAQGNPNAPGQIRKRANQVPDNGVGDDTFTTAPETPSSAVATVHANGMISAQLDESFMEATTVTRRADGTLEYQYFTGLEHARIAVILHQFGGWRAFVPMVRPAAPAAALEEKE